MYKCPFMPCMNCPYSFSPYMQDIPTMQGMQNSPNAANMNMHNMQPIQQTPNMPNVQSTQQAPNMPNVQPMQQTPNMPNMRPMQKAPMMPNMPEDDMEAYIRVLHASPDAPPVDVYIDGDKTIDNLAYGMLAGYIPILPGKHKIEVYPANRTSNPVISASLNFDEDSFTTIAAVNKLANIEPLVINDFDDKVQRNMAMVKFVHMSPNSPAMDITLTDGKKLFSNISFKQISDYISLNPRTYNLQVRLAGTDKVVLNLPNINIRGGVPYSIYAIGLSGSNPPLTVVLVEDEI